MKELFQAFGEVQSCDLVMDKANGESKGFGFVEMPAVGDAKAAMKGLNNKKIGANNIRVKKAEEKSIPDTKSL